MQSRSGVGRLGVVVAALLVACGGVQRNDVPDGSGGRNTFTLETGGAVTESGGAVAIDTGGANTGAGGALNLGGGFLASGGVTGTGKLTPCPVMPVDQFGFAPCDTDPNDFISVHRVKPLPCGPPAASGFCGSDADCPSGEICNCEANGAQASCAPATCISDADCGPGLLCLSYIVTGGCGFTTGYACQTIRDTCALDNDCSGGDICSVEDGKRTCLPAPFCSPP